MRFRDLGPLLIEIDGVERRPGGRKPEIILWRLLAGLNERVSVDALLEALTADSGKPARSDTLESHIWRLRRLLEPGRRPRQQPTVLINDAGGYRLLAAQDDVDSTWLEQLSADIQDVLVASDAERELQLCDEALALWRGEPFGPAAQQEWAQPIVARLEQLRASIGERRIDALLNSGKADRALADLEPMIAATPYREHLWSSKMLALYRLGRVEEALAAYHQARQVLQDDLGMDPGPELRDTQRRIQSHDATLVAERAPKPMPTPPAIVRLPRRATPLIGRDDDVTQLHRLVTGRPLVTIAGVAGSGKTRLAIEVARQAQDEFPGGVWFVDLTATDSDDVVADVISSTLSVEPAAVGSTIDAIVNYVRRRRTLLVLDNCEHVLTGVAEVVDALLAQDLQGAVLATSREPVGVSPEVIWTLGPLPVADSSARTGDDPAVDLFRARALDAAPTLVLDGAAERDLVSRICASVDGLPLAIELAAARVRTNSLAEIAQQVGEDPSRLGRLGRGVDDHRRTIREAIDWSYRLLPEREQRLHRCLSTLPGAFTLTAATAVGGVGPGGPGDTTDALAQLTHRSMVMAAPQLGNDRPTLYTQLATIRGHARNLLDASGDAAEVTARRDDWVDELLGARPRLGYPDPDGWHDRVDDDYSTVRASLQHRLVDEPNATGVAAAARLTTYWRFRASMIEGRRWLELAAGRPDAGRRASAAVRLGLATGLVLQGRTDLMRPWLDAAIADSLSEGDETDLIDVGDRLTTLAHAMYAVGEHDLVGAVSRSLDELARRSGDPGNEIAARVVRFALASAGAPAAAGELHGPAVGTGNLRAALLCCLVATTLALRERDPDGGATWVTRAVSAHLGMGARQIGGYLETWANFATLRGAYADGVTAHAAARQHLLRAGLHWPRGPMAERDLATARDRLDRDTFDRAWRDGDRLTFDAAIALLRAPPA